ncbi:ATP-binding protein [Pseudogemmatithrix spongiicola]|uniref:histidine kinase n=1 Tax=Pseudogemmatithrix spongiicola TaxID=3062599 RepID=A0AA49Q5V5_9BACT|nr:ATP-binding protein [Gemmatimonadaceae bacterium 'strain 138']WKW15955.1 ATP-binding protein [Gemmatimonadaceae bacterium 'strain 318']
MLDPRRLLNGIYVGRLLVASANFAWAVMFALFANPMNTVIAATAFVAAMALTATSYIRTEINRRHAGPGFLYAQFVHDLLLVTVVVHLTGGGDSQFAALYILVNATAALLLPIGSSLLLALLGSVLYAGDAFLVSGGEISIALLLQLVVFVLVVVGTSYIAGQLQEAGQGREQLEAELASAQVRAADILANIRAAIITVDDLGRLLYANPAASRLLGVPFEALGGQPVLRQLQTVSPAVADAVEATIAGRHGAARIEGALAREGRTIPLGITTTAVSGDLRPVGGATTVIVQDISDEKRLEALRLRAQRLEAVAELSASLAHEIKNPLASIRSSVEQLARRATATDDERTLGALITRESDRLSRLLSEFLDFSRVQAERREELDLRDVVRSAVALAGTHPDRSATVAVDVDLPSEPTPLAGDEDLLHRAVFNLVLNACQAVGDHGHVAVSLRAVREADRLAGLPFAGASYALEVHDDGPGIPPDIQDRLFEPFATTKSGGSGLGLAVVHRAIEAHRGVILVDSDRAGTRFTVYLPTDDDPSGASL